MTRIYFCVAVALALFVGADRMVVAGTPAKPPAKPAAPDKKANKPATPDNKPNPTSVPGLKIPNGFSATYFAGPPNVNYPTCIAATPDGSIVYVGCDLNAAQENKPDRGRIMRCVDKDGDGVADEFTEYLKLDSPRGLITDGNALYVLHSGKLTVHFDTKGTGTVDKEDTLIDGIGVDTKTRSQDHSINNIRMGIDGYIYIACGDYGFAKAVAKDGSTIMKHSGGVVRIRTDGTGFEIVSNGQRNIYDVAIDPCLNMFTLDNTNDGGGWDTRFSHVVPFAQFGYPSLFKNFSDEIIQPIHDYGGGSPTGALFIDEGALPQPYGRSLFMVEWGHGKIYRQPLTLAGATYSFLQREATIEIPRPTDFDVDAAGRMYAASWKDGMYRYERPDVGYVTRIVAQGVTPPKVPDVAKATEADLVKLVGGTSHTLRVAAQRELLRRKDAATAADGLRQIVTKSGDLAPRVAAIFTISQLLGAKSESDLVEWTKNADLREFAIEALGDRRKEWPALTSDVLVKSLSDTNPRVRAKAATALARLKQADAVSALAPLVADADPIVAHVARNGLAYIGNVPGLLAASDKGPEAVTAGCMKALQQLHEPAVVDGISQRLLKTTDDATKKLYFSALCRLCMREADWKGDWWGTRPDNAGPYYKAVPWDKTNQIKAALAETVAKGESDLKSWMVKECQRNHVDLPNLSAEALKMAQSDTGNKADAAQLLANLKTLNDDSIKVILGIVQDTKQPAKLREDLIQKLIRSNVPAAKPAAFQAVASIGLTESTGGLRQLRNEYLNAAANPGQLKALVEKVEKGAAAERDLAYAAILKLLQQPRIPAEAKTSATKVVDAAWTKPETTAGILRAIGATNADAFAFQVSQRRKDTDDAVRKAAEFAATELRLDEQEKNKITLATLAYEDVVAAVEKTKGDAALGAKLFVRQGCVNCHTTSPSETPKGPFLGGISTKYKRPELCESILKPSAKIAQGFETWILVLNDGKIIEGFISKDTGDEVELRGQNGVVTVVAKSNIDQHKKSDVSVMPNGLVDKLSTAELAAIVAYLESLPAK